MAATLPLYYFIGASGAITFLALIFSFHIFQLKPESLILAFVGIHSLVTASSVPLVELIEPGYMASEVAYGLNVALGLILFVGMLGASKLLENDPESILLGYISALTISVAAASLLVTIVAGVV